MATIIVASDDPMTRLPGSTAWKLALGQVILGGFALILGITAVIISANMGFMGIGMWCGVTFMITGVVGAMNGRNNWTLHSVTAFLILSVISAVLCITMLFFEVIGLMADANYFNFPGDKARSPGSIACNSMLVIIALAEGVLAITSTVLGCKVACHCFGHVSTGSTMAHYSAIEK